METGKQLIEEAQRLSDLFFDQAETIEAAGRVPADLSKLMAEAGFYRLGVPQEIGGLEASPRLSSEIFEILAQGDASCAWVAFIGTTSGAALGNVSKEIGRQILASPTTMLTGVFAPTGRAELTDEGFRVTGRWQWGSGSQNADWIMGGCMLTKKGEPILDKAGNPANHMMIMPADKVELLDTWHVSGLKGTGSVDYQVDNLLVPTTHGVGYLDHEAHSGPLSSFPSITFLALGIAAVALGIARASIKEFVALAGSKKRAHSRKTIAEQPHTHLKLAEAEAQLRSARAFYYEAIDAVWDSTLQQGRASLALRRDLRLATTYTVTSCVQVVDAMYALGGGVSVYQTSRLQRYLRDVQVARQHIMVSPSVMETAGRLLLDVKANVSMF